MDEKKFSGKVAIITGASSGIGYETAHHFAKLGATLSISGRNVEKLNELSTKIVECSGKKPCITAGDLTDEKCVESLVDNTIKEFGRIDILVNSAGIVDPGTIETTSLQQYDKVMNINTRSVYHLTMLSVPHLIKTKGVIVNVSSVNGMRSFPGVLCYCMSKAAIDQFTRCVALELADHQVRVNSVNPGVIKTEVHKRGGMDEDTYQKFLERSKTTHALGRVGETAEVASVIAFLASDESSFVTGASIPVDGGRHAMCPR